MKTSGAKRLFCIIAVVVLALLTACEAAPSALPGGDSSASASSARALSIMTYSKYEGGPVGCEYMEIETGSRPDSDIQESLRGFSPLPSRVMGDDDAPMAKMEFEEGVTLEDISARAGKSDSNNLDIKLDVEQFDERSYVVVLPAVPGTYTILVDLVWSDGAKETVGFASEVSA